MGGSYKWPPSGGGSAYWGDSVASQASLPPSGAVNGEIRLTRDTKNLYEWDGATWGLILNSSGEVVGPSSSVDGEVALFDSTTGKLLKRATGSGPARLTSGRLSTGNTALGTEVSGTLPVANGGTGITALTGSKALVSASTTTVGESATTATELGYVSGVSSAIQTQLNGKQASGNYVTALTGDVTASGPGSVAATVAAVGGKTAAAVATSVTDTVAATNLNTVSTIVKRDGSGNFSAGTITATLAGNATTATSATTAGSATTATTATTAGNVTGTVAIANGGTNSVASLNNNRVMKSAGGAIVEAAAITANKALASDANGIPVSTAVSDTELGYVSGVTSAIQTQIDARLCTTSVATVSSNVTLTNKVLTFVDTAAARTLTLPAPATSLYIVLKDKTGSAATNNVTVNPAGAQTIDGSSSFLLDANYQAAVIVSDGTNYFVI